MMRITWTDKDGAEKSADLSRRGVRLIGFAQGHLMIASTGEFLAVPEGGTLEIEAI